MSSENGSAGDGEGSIVSGEVAVSISAAELTDQYARRSGLEVGSAGECN